MTRIFLTEEGGFSISAGKRTRLRAAIVPLALSALLAACASPRDGVRLQEAAVSVPNENAAALPPPGGPAIVNIVERRFSNALQQDIFLFTSSSVPGQNLLRVQLFGPVGLELDGEKSLANPSVRPSEISKEMRQAIPGVRLAQSPLYLQNNYGPFSYAFGRSESSNDACLFAWQQIRSPQTSRNMFQNNGTIQIRLRLCDERASEQQLLDVMYGFTIRATFDAAGWNPYGDPLPADPMLGRTGNPIRPSVEEPEIQEPQPQPRPRPQRVVAAPVKAEIEPSVPAKKVQTVPLPNAGETIPLPSSDDTRGTIVPLPSCAVQTGTGAGCP